MSACLGSSLGTQLLTTTEHEVTDTKPDSSRQSDEDVPVIPPSVDEAALMRKIDLRVMPMLFIIYLVAFLDRYVL